MKAALTKTLILMLGLSFTMQPVYASSRFVAPLTFHNALQELQTPRQVVNFLKGHFTFRDDEPLFGEVDYWQSPEEFWMRKEGDCEDYALFTKRIFDLHGIESYVVSFYGDGNFAHTVTIYKTDNGRYNVVNEDRLYKYKSKSIEEALTRIYPAWSWGGIAEKRGNRGWMVQRLTNPNYSPFETYENDFSDFPEYFF